MNDIELVVMQETLSSLQKLNEDKEAQERVISWVCGRLDLANRVNTAQNDQSGDSGNQHNGNSFDSFADLYNAASPKTNADKAAVAAYWLQICEGHEGYASAIVNKELLHLGEAISNITDAFTALKERKPALAIQVRKSGKSRQARKTYKLTKAGIDHVAAMLKQSE